MKKEVYQMLYEIENDHWWFASRRKIIDFFMRDIVSGYKDVPRILDIGCSVGITLELFKQYGWICGVDFYEEALNFCYLKKDARFIRTDASNLPFLSESYEIIVALDLLEHLQDDKITLGEFNRVLKEDGFLIISVPAYMMLWGRLDDLANHFRRYRLKELKEKISKKGFNVKKISYINCFLFPLILISRLAERLFAKQLPTALDLKIPAKIINRILKKIFSSEANIVGKVSFPFGSSIICIAQKKEST